MTTAAQQALAQSIATALRKLEFVEAAWLAGSLGRGAGDVFSDVDILALCADGKAGEVSAALNADLAQIAQPALVSALFGGRVLNVVAADWQRFDVTFIEGAQLPTYNASVLTPLFNRTGREPPRSHAPPYQTTPESLGKLVNEFLRALGLAVIVVGREEYALALSANRESVVEAHRAFAEIFLPRARRLAARIGMKWPGNFEAATRAHLRTHLGMELPKRSGQR